MNDLNEVMMEGRLVRDPQARKLESGALVCTFTIACNTRYVNRKDGKFTEVATYMLIEAWQNVADACVKYLNKGDMVRVAGKIKQSHWEKERVKMEKTFISAEHVEFRSKTKPEAPAQIKTTEEEPDVKEQEEINEEVIKASEE